MHKNMKNVFIILGVSLGGLIVLGLTYLSYFGVTLLIESIFYGSHPQTMPMDLVRRGFALFIVALYLVCDRLRWPHPVKATLMIGPYAMVLITLMLQYYRNLPLALGLCAVLVGVSAVIFWKQKRPWVYGYAAAFSVLMALFYGWPR